jgi:uncharacterized protein (DUF2336 family)
MVVRTPQMAPARDRADDASSLLVSSTRMLVAAGDDNPERLKIYAELASELLDRTSIADRQEIARLLADFAPAPRTILRRLAREPLDVAAPILTRARSLTAIDLLGLLAVVAEGHANLIAARRDLSDDVILALINRGEARPIRTLLENPAFQMTTERAHALAANAHGDPVILAALGQVPAEDDTKPAALFGTLESTARAKMIATSEARRALVGGARGYRPAARPGNIEADGLFQRAIAGDWSGIAHDIARALRLEPDLVDASLADPGGEPLLVLLRAAGLPADAIMRVILFHPTLGRDVAKVRWLGELNERLTCEGAALFIEEWRGRTAPAQRLTDTADGLKRPMERFAPRAPLPRVVTSGRVREA